MVAEPALAPLGPMLGQQLLAELRRLMRVPEFTGFSLAFPAMFYLFVGTQKGQYAGVTAHQYVLASLAAYAVVNVALFSFGVTVAAERGNRIDALLRASPMRPIAPLFAKVVTALVFAFAALLVLYAVAYTIGGVRMDASIWVTLTWRLLLGMIPFIGMGFAFGYLSGPSAAVAVINLVLLPMSFASGIFFPLDILPKPLQEVGPYLPMYHLGRLAWSAIGIKYDDLFNSVLWLIGYTVLFLVVTLWAMRREDDRRFT